MFSFKCSLKIFIWICNKINKIILTNVTTTFCYKYRHHRTKRRRLADFWETKKYFIEVCTVRSNRFYGTPSVTTNLTVYRKATLEVGKKNNLADAKATESLKTLWVAISEDLHVQCCCAEILRRLFTEFSKKWGILRTDFSRRSF